MNFIQRLLFLAGAIVAIGIALSIGVTIFAFLLIVGGAAVVYVAARQFLIAKGILNPRPGVPMDIVDPEVTVIDGEFEQIENPMARVPDEKK